MPSFQRDTIVERMAEEQHNSVSPQRKAKEATAVDAYHAEGNEFLWVSLVRDCVRTVPLVYGVCRRASAPTLSHGGSRLNASKPEANPKTRCPILLESKKTASR